MRSNNTPFSDVCDLISVTATEDADGYETFVEAKTQVFCSVNQGVVRSEFYEAMRSNVKLSVTIEIWQDDYNDAKLIDFNGKRYEAVRAYPTGHGTIEISCSEVTR